MTSRPWPWPSNVLLISFRTCLCFVTVLEQYCKGLLMLYMLQICCHCFEIIVWTICWCFETPLYVLAQSYVAFQTSCSCFEKSFAWLGEFQCKRFKWLRFSEYAPEACRAHNVTYPPPPPHYLWCLFWKKETTESTQGQSGTNLQQQPIPYQAAKHAPQLLL